MTLHLGTGPVVVGPELVAGVPAEAATRAGRGLALQLLAIFVVRQTGLPAERLLVGALPAWILGEHEGIARAAAEVALRAAVLPEHALAFAEPGGLDPGRWAATVHAVLPPERAALVIPRVSPGSFALAATATRSAVETAIALAGSTSEERLEGVALEHARDCAAAAIETLEQLAKDGWGRLLGEDAMTGPSIGGDSVAERSGGGTGGLFA